MNCQIKKVIVSISSLGSKLSGEHLTVHLYASNEAEKLLVGRVDFMGKTDADFKCSLNVICPDGFDLSAIAVDEFGAPHPFHVCRDIAVADDLYYPCGGFLTPEKAMSKELSGAAGDVLHALFFRGALVDGDLPSKAGAAELRELGYVKKQDTVTPFCGEHHFNFLTPAGQEFAISYLVDSKFGKRPPRTVRELVIKTSINASELQSTIDEVLDSIRKSDVFKVLSGQTIINDTLTKGADVNSATIKGTLHLTAASDQCLMEPLSEAACERIRALKNTHLEGFNVGINPLSTAIKLSDEMRDAVIAAVRDSGQFVEKPTGDEQQSVEFKADRFKIQANVDAIVEATKATYARQEAMMADLASAQAALTEHINQVVNDAIANALRPGGLLYARK